MEILTILKANIKKKKATFVSVAILMAIILSSISTILSVQDNYNNAIANAFEKYNCGNICLYIEPDNLTDKLRFDIENNGLVKNVQYFDSIMGTEISSKNNIPNSVFLLEMRKEILLYNKTLSDFEETVPPLKSGEIYLPLGAKTLLECNVGDNIYVDCLDARHKFKVKGFVQEPWNGSASIGYKQIFISSTDYNSILKSCQTVKEKQYAPLIKMVFIFKADNCILSDAKFQRQLNLDTKIIANSLGSLTKDQSMHYTGILFKVISNILMLFVCLLFIIVLIVIGYNITIEIEMDYVNLGIMKSQGFTHNKIRYILILQYMLAEIAGIVIGSIVSFPLERIISKVLMSTTAILPDTGISVAKSLIFIVAVLLLSIAIIYIKTTTISKISPVNAIMGGKKEIYFDSRLNLPINKSMLSASLALRQFTSNIKKYTGTIIIVAILTFFMLSVNLISNILSSQSALEAMGINVYDINVHFNQNYNDKIIEKHIRKIENITKSFSDINKKYYGISKYMSINGENIYFTCYKYPEYILGIQKGRAPLYDNEIIITKIVADTLEIKMGDEVKITNNQLEDTYIISGIYQGANDTGMCCAMSIEGAKKLGINSINYMNIVLKDTSKKEEIAEKINTELGDVVIASTFYFEKEGFGGFTDTAVSLVKIIIYAFSIIFAIVVISMVCNKTFIQERTNIGIYKTMGFSSNNLRLQFAVRFFIVSLIGAAFGIALSAAFSAKLLGKVLSIIGFIKVITNYTLMTVLIPIAVTGICFFIFAYFASRKIKKVEARELISE